jgi:cob(I)alamin adenosyltransferase
MNEFMKFESDSLDEEVSVEVNGTVRDMISILGIITIIQSDGYDVDGALSNIYDQIFEQIMSYGSLIPGDINE